MGLFSAWFVDRHLYSSPCSVCFQHLILLCILTHMFFFYTCSSESEITRPNPHSRNSTVVHHWFDGFITVNQLLLSTVCLSKQHPNHCLILLCSSSCRRKWISCFRMWRTSQTRTICWFRPSRICRRKSTTRFQVGQDMSTPLKK